MLAKGRLLGIQFGELYGTACILSWEPMRTGWQTRYAAPVCQKGYPSWWKTPQTRYFPSCGFLLESWKDKYSYQPGRVDESHAAIRLCTSWITSGEQVDILVNDILNSSRGLAENDDDNIRDEGTPPVLRRRNEACSNWGLKPGELRKRGTQSAGMLISIHRSYLEAGANIMTTNTFGANGLGNLR